MVIHFINLELELVFSYGITTTFCYSEMLLQNRFWYSKCSTQIWHKYMNFYAQNRITFFSRFPNKNYNIGTT